MITLATLEKATPQEVFDQGALHLLTQNEQCLNGVVCRYRHGGLKCAGGCFIGDYEYKVEMEGHTWNQLTKDTCIVSDHAALITELQRIHDTFGVSSWKSKLEELATILNLKMPQL